MWFFWPQQALLFKFSETAKGEKFRERNRSGSAWRFRGGGGTPADLFAKPLEALSANQCAHALPQLGVNEAALELLYLTCELNGL